MRTFQKFCFIVTVLWLGIGSHKVLPREPAKNLFSALNYSNQNEKPSNELSFSFADDSIIVQPDTLFFLTIDDFVFGQDFTIQNLSVNTVRLDTLFVSQNWGYDILDTTEDFIEIPQTLNPEDSISVIVRPLVPTNRSTASFYFLTDTVFVVLALDTFTVTIILDPNVVSVESNSSNEQILTEPLVAQNYPNPFNATTVISYTLPYSGRVTVKIYDLLGREITTLSDRFQQAGKHEISFDASELASGFYYYRFQMGNYVKTKKMLLLK